MMGAWLTLIGIGEDGAVPTAARPYLDDAVVVFGSSRHFDLAGAISGKKRTWPSPFANVYDELKALKGKRVAILATGDPQWYGIGSTLARHFPEAEMRVLPAPSAFQLASALLGWPLQNVETISLHGRPVETLRSFLYPGARILALTSNAGVPQQVADILADEGFGKSRMTVLEHMGGDRERMVSSIAEGWSETVADFHTLALEVEPVHGTHFRARVPGLPDDAFVHDGKMTKQEVRAITLSHLMPHPHAVLWDIGSGCGSVAIEWLRAAHGARAVGLEPNAGRRQMAEENAMALGVPGAEFRDATAPSGLADLPEPDAIFIGGGLTSDGVMEACHAALKSGGRMVANAVTLESEAVLTKAYQKFGGGLSRLSVQRASAVGNLTGWRPLMPVTQWSFIKP